MRLFDSLRSDRRHVQPRPRFEYFEIVRVRISPRTRAQRLAGHEGAVVGMSLERAPLTYAVSLRDGRTWFVHESDLESTGRRDRPEQHLGRIEPASLAADAPLAG